MYLSVVLEFLFNSFYLNIKISDLIQILLFFYIFYISIHPIRDILYTVK